MEDQLFSDLLVIDCASFVAGPAAGTILGDFGARVIKIEPPGMGDPHRHLKHLPGLPVSDTNYPWTLTNRNKESLALDLKQAEGRAFLDKLMARADVFITTFPLPVRRRLRLEYEDVQGVNPGLIYASLTPYGETGPEADSTGYDATAWWARSGLMEKVRATADTPPAVSVPAMGDHMAANSLYAAIVTALYRRQRTGKGSRVGSSLMGNGLWSNGLYVQAALDGADTDIRLDPDTLSPFTFIYRCRDDRWFMLAVLLQAQEQAWPTIARGLGHPEWLEDSRFVDAESRQANNVALRDLFTEAFLERDWADWERVFAENSITAGRVATTGDQPTDEQARAAGLLVPCAGDGSRLTVDSPLFVDGEKKTPPSSAPEVGEHSRAILAEFGIDEATVSAWREANIIS